MEDLHKLMTQYRDLCVEFKPLATQLDSLKKQIQGQVKEIGHTVEHDGITAQFRNGYTRASWDGKKLDGYAAAHPEILEFRTEREIGPSVSVKV